MLLVGLPPTPSYITLAHQPRNGIARNDPSPPSLPRNLKNASQTLPRANPSKKTF